MNAGRIQEAMTAPACLRYGQVLEFLEAHEVSRTIGRYLLSDGTIRPVDIGTSRKQKLYSRAQIQRDVLDKLNEPAAEGPAPHAQTGRKQDP